MIRFRLKEKLADKEFRENRQITHIEIAEATGLHRQTIASIANLRGYSTTTENIGRLCEYFECQPGELMESVAEPLSSDHSEKKERQSSRRQEVKKSKTRMVNK